MGNMEVLDLRIMGASYIRQSEIFLEFVRPRCGGYSGFHIYVWLYILWWGGVGFM